MRTFVPLAVAATIVAVLLPARSVAAQASDPLSSAAPSSRPIRIGFGGGVTVPRQGASAQTLKSGMHGQGFVVFQLPAGLPALRANVDFARMRFETPSTASASGVDGDRTLLAGVLGMKLDLLHGPVRPYLLGGVGAFSLEDAIDGATSDAARSQVNFGIDAGAGLSLRLGPLDAFVESRLQNVYTRQRGLVDTKSITAFPVTFGFVL
jgi:hypothetical protein